MNPRTSQFIIFCVFNLASLALGYAARRRNWVNEELSRPIHLWTVVLLWSPVALLSLWKLPPQPQNAWLLVIEPLLVAIPAFGMIPLARWIGCDRRQTGVLAVAAGGGNLSFTLGAYLCYTMLAKPELSPTAGLTPHAAAVAAGDAALAYAIAQVTIMAVVSVVILYPIAQYFAADDSYPLSRRERVRVRESPTDGNPPERINAPAVQRHPPPAPPEGRGATKPHIGKLIRQSLFDLRAAMLYAAVIGVVLAYAHVPFPHVIDRIHLLDILFYLGGFGGYVGIGLRLHFGRAAQYVGPHALLAAVKFLGIPVATFVILMLVNFSPAPVSSLAWHVMMLEAFMPTAIQTVIIANLFHLDARLASGLWLVSTLLFLLIPLPLLFWAMA